jgi:hypothetical protein
MGYSPLSGMLDGSTWRQDRTEFPYARQCLHPLASPRKGGVLWIHRFAFVRETEREGTWQQVEVSQAQLGAQQIVLSVPRAPLCR